MQDPPPSGGHPSARYHPGRDADAPSSNKPVRRGPGRWWQVLAVLTPRVVITLSARRRISVEEPRPRSPPQAVMRIEVDAGWRDRFVIVVLQRRELLHGVVLVVGRNEGERADHLLAGFLLLFDEVVAHDVANRLGAVGIAAPRLPRQTCSEDRGPWRPRKRSTPFTTCFPLDDRTLIRHPIPDERSLEWKRGLPSQAPIRDRQIQPSTTGCGAPPPRAPPGQWRAPSCHPPRDRGLPALLDAGDEVVHLGVKPPWPMVCSYPACSTPSPSVRMKLLVFEPCAGAPGKRRAPFGPDDIGEALRCGTRCRESPVQLRISSSRIGSGQWRFRYRGRSSRPPSCAGRRARTTSGSPKVKRAKSQPWTQPSMKGPPPFWASRNQGLRGPELPETPRQRTGRPRTPL